MTRHFSVMVPRPEDLSSVSAFLASHSAAPPETAWTEIYRRMAGRSDDSGDRFSRGASYIVVDRIGAVRAFCVTQRLEHPIHRLMLDVPVLVIEDGPNRDEIARTLFDHVVEVARDAAFDAVRFRPQQLDAWQHWLEAGEVDQDDLGLIMPLSASQPQSIAPEARILRHLSSGEARHRP